MPEAHKTTTEIFIAHKLSEVLNRSLVECPISCIKKTCLSVLVGQEVLVLTHMLLRTCNHITHLLSQV